jgi:quercetin dioxygenase-like cupin family protein
MHRSFKPIRLLLLAAAALGALTSFARAQDKPVTLPDSYRVVMENDRVRMIEVHVKPHSKVNVESPPNRERFLYMLSDGALILAPPGKMPYEFAMHAGETAVFPAVSPTVENDTDSAVRALMVEVKQPMRTEVASKTRGKGKYAKGKSRTRVAARSADKTRHTSSSRKSSASAAKTKQPLNLSKANAKSKKASGKGKGSSS